MSGHEGSRELAPPAEEGPGAAREKEMDGASADVLFSIDIYDSVVVAAFGGLTQNLARDRSLTVHPFFVMVLSFPLFIAQANCLFFLRLTQDLGAPIVSNAHNATAFEVLEDPSGGHVVEDRILLAMKLLMIVILQLLLFGKLLTLCRLLVFAVNPTTWTDIRRPTAQEMKMKFSRLFRAPVLIPCVWLSLTLKLMVVYAVCLDSVSIILASSEVSNVILDSLSALFIADLGSYWWLCVATIFRLDKFDTYDFKMASKEVCSQANKRSWIAVPATGGFSFLHRGKGARAFETCLTFTLLTIIYFRQLVVVLEALDTNILPLARDVCTMWRWDTGRSRHFAASSTLFRFFESRIMVMDITKYIEDTSNPERGGFCSDEYYRMVVSAALHRVGRHPLVAGAFTLLLLFLLILPQIFYAFNERIRKLFYPEGMDDDAAKKRVDVKEEAELLSNENASLRYQLQEMKKKMKMAAKDLNALQTPASYSHFVSTLPPLRHDGKDPRSLAWPHG